MPVNSSAFKRNFRAAYDPENWSRPVLDASGVVAAGLKSYRGIYVSVILTGLVKRPFRPAKYRIEKTRVVERSLKYCSDKSPAL